MLQYCQDSQLQAGKYQEILEAEPGKGRVWETEGPQKSKMP